jgi:hypothetical protein
MGKGHVRDTECPECRKLLTRGGISMHRLYHHQVPMDKTLAQLKSGDLKRNSSAAGGTNVPPSGSVPDPERVPRSHAAPAKERRRGFFSA